MQPYSPERRTALVLCGTGAHGAYHAGALRALQEAGVKIDVMAGQGVGAGTAALAAVDGAARLWDAQGIWRGAAIRTFYRWKWPLRVAGWLSLLLVPVLAAPLLLLGLGLASYPIEFLSTALTVITLLLVLASASAMPRRLAPVKRKTRGAWWWHLLGAPFDADTVRETFAGSIWQLIRGGAQGVRPLGPAIGRRYADVLADNIGQPGFRELMLVATDLDARRDVVGALLLKPYRHEFVAPRPDRERDAEAIDLAGSGRDHAFDLIAAGLTPPLGCDPHMMTFAADGYWRGETHRLCDRPGAVVRLLEELAAVGVSQAIIVSAVAAPSSPHRLTVHRLEIRHRLGEFLAVAESAALRDAIEMARLRFDSVYLICPTHNPVGAFDFGGAYDEASDRRQDLVELMERAYEDAYRQFIDPVIGASGEQLAGAHAREAPSL